MCNKKNNENVPLRNKFKKAITNDHVRQYFIEKIATHNLYQIGSFVLNRISTRGTEIYFHSVNNKVVGELLTLK